MRLTGVYTPDKSRYVRFHVNGEYLRYMTQYEHSNSDAMERYADEVNKRCRHQATEPPPDLFKAQVRCSLTSVAKP